ncbi:hypothetical protein JX265_003588 [Neoarthrinium moseri]|uniref:Uncharacterized protein n=1 Tax=Neoarthrinium moseri TaxID=1658444 RepID=A0A9Q0ASD0_9PEZI|nr:hypothetical protein JX265_003588 [Neoarthrinium moseri]
MDNLAQLESSTSALATAIQGLALCFQSNDGQGASSIIDPRRTLQVDQARRNVLSIITKIKTLILACIPRTDTVSIKDVADLAHVAESQLRRVIRLTATQGFLREEPHGYIGHTALSEAFFDNPLLLDAAIFMAESAAPAALKMDAPNPDDSEGDNRTAYNLAVGGTKPFHMACQEQPRLSRQYRAYLQYAAGMHVGETLADTLAQFNWSNTRNARELPNFETGVDSDADLPNIQIMPRALGTKQPITDAGLYILHVSSFSLGMIQKELQIHCGVLRANKGIVLIPTAYLLPEPGNICNILPEAIARSRDLGMLQLSNESELEFTELLHLIGTVRNGSGRLAVTRRLVSSNNTVTGLVLEYQAEHINYDL